MKNITKYRIIEIGNILPLLLMLVFLFKPTVIILYVLLIIMCFVCTASSIIFGYMVKKEEDKERK